MIFVILCHWGTLGYFSYRLAKIFLPQADNRDPYAPIWKYLTFSRKNVLDSRITRSLDHAGPQRADAIRADPMLCRLWKGPTGAE